jgi:hypothetical protein
VSRCLQACLFPSHACGLCPFDQTRRSAKRLADTHPSYHDLFAATTAASPFLADRTKVGGWRGGRALARPVRPFCMQQIAHPQPSGLGCSPCRVLQRSQRLGPYHGCWVPTALAVEQGRVSSSAVLAPFLVGSRLAESACWCALRICSADRRSSQPPLPAPRSPLWKQVRRCIQARSGRPENHR